MHSQQYEVRLRGRLPSAELVEFAGMTASIDNDLTILRGTVSDQAALVGLVVRAESLGLEVVEMIRISPVDGKPDESR